MKSSLSTFRTHPRKFAWMTTAIVACSVALAACGDDVAVPKASMPMQEVAAAPATGLMGRAGGAERDALHKLDETTAQSSPAPPPPDQTANPTSAAIVAPAMVIRNGTATLEVDSLELAIAAVEKLAASMGGYIGNTSLSSGSNAVRSADLEVKIPAAKYEATVNNLGPIGKVEAQTSTAEDVGEEFFDVTARQANSKRLEERLITLLATRTGKLEDVLAVERELARVREEIERFEGRLRYLKSHVATSTLQVTLHEPHPIVGGYQGSNVIVEAFKDAWRNFVSFFAFLISSLGVLVPLLALLIVGGIILKRSSFFARRNKVADKKSNNDTH